MGRRGGDGAGDGAALLSEEGDGPRRRGSVPQELCNLREAPASAFLAATAAAAAHHQHHQHHHHAGLRGDGEVGNGVQLVGIHDLGAAAGSLPGTPKHHQGQKLMHHHYPHEAAHRAGKPAGAGGDEDRARFKRKTSVYLDDRWGADGDGVGAGPDTGEAAGSVAVGAAGNGPGGDWTESGPCTCLDKTLSQPAALVLVCIWFGLSAIFYLSLHRAARGSLGVGDIVAQAATHFWIACLLMFFHGALMQIAGHEHKHEALAVLWEKTPKPVWVVLGFAHLVSHAMLLSAMAVLDVSTLQFAMLAEPALAVIMALLRWVPQTHAPLSTSQVVFGLVLGGGALMASIPTQEVVSGVTLVILSSTLLQWRLHVVRRMMQKVHADAAYVAFGITSAVGLGLALFIMVILYTTSLSVFAGLVSVESGFYYFGANAISLLLTQVYSQGAHEGLRLLQRIVVAVVAACVQFEHITLAQWIGVAVAAVGWVGLDMDRHQSSVRRSSVLGLLAISLVGLVLLGGTEVQTRFGPETWLQARSQRPFTPGISEDGRIEELRPFCEVYEDQLYSIWAYPFGPEPSVMRRCPTEVVYCAYSECLKRFAGARRLNLAVLTRGTPYEKFVRHHMWQKVRHKRQFIHHVQSVAMLSLLLKKPGICVRIIGDVRWHCHSDRNWPSLDYDPESLSMMPHFMPHKPVHFPKEFTSFSYVSRMKKFVGVDLGDELQAFAGLSFVPYLTHFTDRDQGLPSARGHLFMNTWYGPNVRWPPGPQVNPVLLSVHTSPKFRKLLLAENLTYFKDYNAHHGLVGARDHSTLEFLLTNGVRAFSSGCFSTIVDIIKESGQPPGNTTFLVDVARTDLIPNTVLNVVERRSVLPAIEVLQDEEGIHQYAFALLRSFAEDAKLVITSRVHIGLVAMAQGVPVVFLKPPRRADATVTDVKGASGAGMDEIISFFHVLGKDQPLLQEFNWTHPPPNPGNHIVDRHRATFWKYVSQSSRLYADTAFLFGVVPLRRLGHGQPHGLEPPQEVFHMALPSANAVTNGTLRLVESVFRHHPNAKLVVHCNDMGVRHTDLVQLALVGYDVTMESFNLVQQLRQLHLDHGLVKRFVSHVRAFPNDLSLLPVLVLYIHGGVFLRDHTGIMTSTIPLSFPAAWQDDADLLLFPKGSPMLLRAAELFLRNPQLSLENALIQAINEFTFDAFEEGIMAQDDKPDFTVYGSNSSTPVLKLRSGAFFAGSCSGGTETPCENFFEDSCIFCHSRDVYDAATRGL